MSTRLNDSASPGAGESSGGASIRTRVACVTCRSIKIRCHNDGGHTACQRCKRMELPCNYQTQRRGRKTNAERAARGGPSRNNSALDSATTFRQPVDPVTSSFASFPSTTLNPSAFNFNFTDPSSSQTSMPSTRPNQSFQADGSATVGGLRAGMDSLDVLAAASTSAAQPLSTQDPLIPGVNRDRGRQEMPRINIMEMLDPSPGSHQSDTISSTSPWSAQKPADNPPPTNPFDDPINLNFVSEVQADHLVHQFHLHLNPMINLLDEKLHTLSYIRESSTALLTAILAAASKFFNPSLYLPLLSHAQTLINRATVTGICDIGTVQSLMIIVYWKEPSDRSVWIKIGMAVRMGYQLGWHIGKPGPKPPDDMAARKILNEERTWFGLVCFDRTYSALFRLPSMIRSRDFGDPAVWAINNARYNVSSDMRTACSADHVTSLDLSELQSDFSGIPKDALKLLLEQKVQAQIAIYRKWFSDEDGSSLSPRPKALLEWLHWNRLLRIKRIAIDADLELDGGVSDALDTLSRVVQEIQKVSEEGRLLYMQDILACALSDLAVFVYQIFWKLSPAQKAFSIKQLKSVHECCPTGSIGAVAPATAFVARFIERILRHISIESRANSRPGSPSLLGQIPEMTDLTAMNDLNDFLSSLMDGDTGDATFDANYWSSLAFGDADNLFMANALS